MQRWIAVDVFEATVYDLRVLCSVTTGRAEQSSAFIFNGHTLQLNVLASMVPTQKWQQSTYGG